MASSHAASAFVTCSKRRVRAVVPGVYPDNGVSAPPIEQGLTEPGANGGFIAHQFISENGKPLLKFEDFDRTMRGGMGRHVDVALIP